MGEFVNGRPLTALAAVVATLVIALNALLVLSALSGR
jgi:hypothetical protein